IHRDIKPGNILLTSRSSQITAGKPLPEDFEPVLTDFGLVRFLDSTQHTTGSGQIAGTPAYMSPEQARGEITDGRTDIYSLGIVLYEILAGRLPFDGETTMGVLMKQINEPPAPVPGLPPTMQLVLDRALAKDLDERFQSPAEFAEAFSAAVENRADFATVELADPSSTKKNKKKPATRIFQRAKPRWSPWILAALAGVVVTIAVGAPVVFNVFSPPVDATPTPIPVTFTSTARKPLVPILGPTGILSFKDRDAIADQAVLTASAMTSPPAGSQYEVSLIGNEDRQSLGILSLDANGKGSLAFIDSQSFNLIALYDEIAITIEPKPDPDPDVYGPVAYSFSLPTAGLLHVRYLLASYPGTPNNVGLIQGIYNTIQIIDEAVHEMENADKSNDKAGVLESAELAMNVLVGDESPDHKDWNADGETADTADGYGLLLNANNLGYIQALYSEADYATNTPGATQKMITHGEDVKTCTQNFALWSPQLYDLLMTILTSPSATELSQPILDAVILADKMLNGIDLNGNEKVDPLVEECGAKTAYEYSYYMADMILLPAGIVPTVVTTTPNPTATATIQIAAPTSTPGGGGGGGETAPTAKPQVPTKKPKNDPPGKTKAPTKD
ncbi:MAG: protein kinase, partial [Chloroflexota bacterium]